MANILLIEDDPDLQLLMSTKLEQEGFKVIQAFTGEDALKFAKDKPALILLDILLPDIDGLTILNELTADDSTKDIPVIILSNLADNDSMEQAKAIGDYEYIVKARTDLNAVVDRVRKKLNMK